MKGVLLDTNHVRAWIDKHPTFMKRLEERPADMLPRVCSITLGELACGHMVTTTTDASRRDEHRRFVVNELHPFAWEIGIQHADKYAEIISRVCANRHKGAKALKDFLAEQKVDINDIWIVSVAMAHNLTLLTTDKMEAIREAVGPEVEFDNWCV